MSEIDRMKLTIEVQYTKIIIKSALKSAIQLSLLSYNDHIVI